MADDNEPESDGKRDQETQENIGDASEDGILNHGDGDLDSLVVEAAQEYVALDSTLDQIDSFLNKLEEKNDDLYQKAQELLESSRQTRLEMQQSNDNTDQKGGGPDDGVKPGKS